MCVCVCVCVCECVCECVCVFVCVCVCVCVKEEGQLQSSDCALGMIAWVHISTALESTLTPTARYAAITNQWIETI